MSWLDSLEVPIEAALASFPPQVSIGSIAVQQRTYLVTHDSLTNMCRMHLGHLPVSTVALPYELSEILTRPHAENLVRDVSHHLSDFFPNFFVAAIYELQSIFAAQGLDAFIIVGITRDMLLSSERRYDIQDVDITLEGNALEVARAVIDKSRNFSFIQDFEPFGTAKLNYKNQIDLDFASTRREVYTGCGLLPEIMEMGVPLEEDIIRRDFTINALALSIRHPGEVIDCTGGLQDIESRSIRLLKAESFFEDPTRILRALKFATRLGFDLTEDTQLLLDEFLRWMPEVYKGGGTRIREELFMFLSLPESENKAGWFQFFLAKGLYRLIDTHLPATLELPLPFNVLLTRLTALQASLAEIWTRELTWEIYIALIFLGLPKSLVEPATHRLELTRPELEVVDKSFRLLQENVIFPLTPYDNVTQLYDVFHSYPLGAICVGILLSANYEKNIEALLHYKRSLEPTRLEINGEDVLKLGVPQGEQVGRLLKALFYAKLQGRVSNRIEELSWLKSTLAEPVDEPAS